MAQSMNRVFGHNYLSPLCFALTNVVKLKLLPRASAVTAASAGGPGKGLHYLPFLEMSMPMVDKHILFTELWTGRETGDDWFPPRHVPCRNLKPRAHFSAPCRFPLSHLPCSVDSMTGVHSGRVWTRETLFSDSHISVIWHVCWLCPVSRDPIQ